MFGFTKARKGIVVVSGFLTVLLAGERPAIHQNIPAVSKAKMKAVKSKKTYATGEVIVRYKKGISKNNVKVKLFTSEMKATFFNFISQKTEKVMVHVKSKKLSTEQLLKKFQSNPDVEYVEPNYIVHSMKTPNDGSFDQLWGLHNTGQSVVGNSGKIDADIDAPEAWEQSTGSSNVVVAVIDTGVDYGHEDLSDNMWTNSGEVPNNGIDDDGNGYIDDVHGINTIDDSGDPMDIFAENGGHGTHVSGTIAAAGNNGTGVTGVNWNAKIMACKFQGVNGGTTVNAIKCLEYIADQKNRGVNIVATNNSWGGGSYSEALRDAIKITNDLGIVFVAAAGNDGANNDSTPAYPASYDLPGVISVAASDYKDDIASYSNYGHTSVDLAAPGSTILSTTPREHIGHAGDIFFDNFENGFDNWTTGGTHNTWAISTDQEIFENSDYPVPSPAHFLSDSPGVDYVSDTDSWVMINHDINLTGVSGDVFLGFGSAINIEGDDYDHAYVEISADSGSNWMKVYDFTGYGRYWHNAYSFKIPEAYKTAHFRVRFHLTSDDSFEYDGWLIDDVGIGTSFVPTYSYYSGTSMATPHVTGSIALMAALFPQESMNERIKYLLSGVDSMDSFSGLTVSGGRLNLAKALNRSPVALDDSAGTDENSSVAIHVLENDSDPNNDTLHVAGHSYPSHGNVEIDSTGTITYTPEADFSGTDVFSYTVNDGNGGTDTAEVTVTVISTDTDTDTDTNSTGGGGCTYNPKANHVDFLLMIMFVASLFYPMMQYYKKEKLK